MDLTARSARTISSSSVDIAFESLFQQYWTSICRVLYRITGDWDEAEDLALETFMRWYYLPPVQQDNPRGWLYRVATNLALNALRSQKRRLRYETQALPTSSAEDPSQVVEHRQESERVRLALAEQKPRTAQLLVLRHSGFSYAEIADVLEIAPGSVGTLLARATEEFERIFRRLEGEGK